MQLQYPKKTKQKQTISYPDRLLGRLPRAPNAALHSNLPKQHKILCLFLSLSIAFYSQPNYAAPAVDALPTGASINAGVATINTVGNQMTITQSSNQLSLNWQNYNIGANASVTYQQPSNQSVALNRVLSADPSQIYGHLNANGSVILINPNGIVVGPGAKINVGAMILSTMDLSDSDFLSNNYHFTTPSADGLSALTPQILSQGSINAAAGGYVTLIGHNIQNQGSVSVPGGTVGLLAGDTVSLNLSSANGVIPTVSAAVNGDARISQSGTINTAGGSVQLISYNAGNSGADINSHPLAHTVVLDQNGTINTGGGSILLDGGVIGITQHSGRLDTVTASGIGGNVTMLGDKIGLLADSQIDASGSGGGGTVLVGGNWQGLGPEHQASAVYMDPSALITANAQQQGNGGKVVLWSNDYTGFYGTISAQGGSQGGDGGQVETSSHDNLQANGTVDASAVLGKAGSWLLDPQNVTISATGTYSVGGTNPYTSTTNSSINATSIETALAAGNSVTIQTGAYDANDSTTLGDINNQIGILTLAAPISPNLANANFAPTLTLRAGIALALNSEITATGLGKLNVDLYSAATNLQTNATQVAGIIEANSSIRTNGGNLTFTTGLGTYITGAYVPVADAGQNKFITNGGALSFNAAPLSGTPAVASTADIFIANPNGVFIDTACGAACTAGLVTFNGRVDSGDEYRFESAPNITWDDAYIGALNPGGAASQNPNDIGATYLSTVSSAFQNTLIGKNACNGNVCYLPSWLGGARFNAGELASGTSYNQNTNTYTVSLPATLTTGWQWITGPLSGCSALTSCANTVTGKQFYSNTTFSAAPPGAGTVTDVYQHWDNTYNGAVNQEPNNLGPEYVLEFVGTAGYWNDYAPSNTSNIEGYSYTKNLAPSSLQINADTVTFNGAVGSIKPLSTLTVTAPTVNINGGAITTGAQIYSSGTANPVTINLGAQNTELRTTSQYLPNGKQGCTNVAGCVTGGTLYLNNSVITYNGTANGNQDGTLLLHAFNDVILGANQAINAMGNKLNVTIQSGDSSLNTNATPTGGAIVLSAGSNINTNGGNVLLGGPGGTTATSSCTGIGANESCAQNSTVFNSAVNIGGLIASSSDDPVTGITNTPTPTASSGGATINTGGGAITILGSSASNAGAGVTISGNSQITSGTGAINIIGNASNGATGIAILPVTVANSTGTPTIGNGGTGTISLTADSMNFGSPTTPTLNGTGVLNLLPYTASTNINLGAAGTGLNIASSVFSGTNRAFSTGLTRIDVGGVMNGGSYPNSGTITLDGLNYGNSLTINTSGNIVLVNTVQTNSGNALTLNNATGSNIGSNISGSGSLSGGQLITVNTDGQGANAGTYSGTISGASTALTKTGSGTLTLTGANTYTGATTINLGTLTASASGSVAALGSNSAQLTAIAVATGAVFKNDPGNNITTTIASLVGAAGSSAILNSGTLITGGNNADTTFSGVLSGAGNLIKTGSGNFTLAGANIYTGTTTVNQGTVTAATGALGSSAGQLTAVTVASGAVFNNNPGSNNTNTIASLAGAGNVQLSSGTLTTGGDNTSTTLNGMISGTGNLTKSGGGVFTLPANNSSYSGVTTINGGTIMANHANALGGVTTGGININGGTLILNNLTLASGANNAAVLGAVNINTGGTLNSIGTAGLSGVLNVNDDSTVVALRAANGQPCSAANPCSLTFGAINIASYKTLILGNGSYLTLNTGAIDPIGANLTVNTTSSYTANGAIGGIGDVLAAVTITAHGTTLQNVTANQINVTDTSTTGVNLNGVLDASNSTAGTVTIDAQNGSISVAGDIKAGATSGNAITLKAGSSSLAGDVTGGDVILANGVTFMPAAGGQVLVYTGSIANSGYAGDFTQALASSPTYYYEQGVSFNPPAAAYNIVYRQIPGVSIMFNDPNATYNAQAFPGFGSNNNLNYISTTLVGYAITCQVASYCPTTLTGSLSVPNNSLIDAGVYTVSPGTLNASNSSNSSIAFTWLPSIYTIKPKPLLIQGLSADNKIYDATAQATFNAGALSTVLDAPGASTTDGNLYSGDQVTFALNNLVGAFQNGKNVGMGPVIVTSWEGALTGASAGNYTLDPQSWANLSATISPANLILTPTAESVDYGALPINPVQITVIRGTQTVIQSNSNYSALLGGDTISNLYAEFKDFSSIRKLGDNCCQIIVASGYVVNDGNQGGNYIINDSAIAQGSIRAKLVGATTGDASTSSLPDGTLKSVVPWSNGRVVSGENKYGAWARTADTQQWDVTAIKAKQRVQLVCGSLGAIGNEEICGRRVAQRSSLVMTRSYQMPEIEFKK